jgi:hypothetical protein
MRPLEIRRHVRYHHKRSQFQAEPSRDALIKALRFGTCNLLRSNVKQVDPYQ